MREVKVCNELFYVGKFLMEIFTAFLFFPIAWKLLQRQEMIKSVKLQWVNVKCDS